MRTSSNRIAFLENNQIFVFGSNEGGIHGAGAAKQAVSFGAVYGVAEGLQGNSYAIPTKDRTVKRTLSVEAIKVYVDRFIEFAKQNPHLTFLVTQIGCGLAGYSTKTIAPLFENAIPVENIWLPQTFWDVLEK